MSPVSLGKTREVGKSTQFLDWIQLVRAFESFSRGKFSIKLFRSPFQCEWSKHSVGVWRCGICWRWAWELCRSGLTLVDYSDSHKRSS
jgi:hypothetical protein